MGNTVAAAARTDTFLGARYRRLAKHRGKHKAIIAVGNSVLTITWHLLADPNTGFHDLGATYYTTRLNKHRRARDLAQQLQAVTGQTIHIHHGKAVITETAA